MKIRRRWLNITVIIIIMSVEMIWSAVAEQEVEGKPVFINMIKDTVSTLKKSHKNYWDKLKTVFHHAQLKFFPPDLDFKSKDRGVGTATNTGEKMKEAAEKSFEASKTTAQDSAKTAAKVVGEAVHKAKDKLSDDKSNHDEL